MKIIVATRTYNEQYFIETFIQHYLGIGVDEILFFDSASQDESLKIINSIHKKNNKVSLAISTEELRHTSDSKEAESCNYVLQYAIKKTLTLNEPIWWIFPDIDEFFQKPQGGLRKFLSSNISPIMRGVFLEWYLSPSQAIKDISSRKMLKQALRGRLKGKHLLAMEDPFYKDCLIRLDPQLITSSNCIKFTLGNHRLLINNEIFIGKSFPWALFHHLRGVPFAEYQRRIRERINLLQARHDEHYDAHCYHRFEKLQKQLRDYECYHASLQTISDINIQIEIARNFDPMQSQFNMFFKNLYLARETAHILKG
jgi:glycosyltransferase involved in cell wall biosynthesis